MQSIAFLQECPRQREGGHEREDKIQTRVFVSQKTDKQGWDIIVYHCETRLNINCIVEVYILKIYILRHALGSIRLLFAELHVWYHLTPR